MTKAGQSIDCPAFLAVSHPEHSTSQHLKPMMMSTSNSNRVVKSLMCPSADVEMPGSVIFGMVVGTPQPQLVHLDRVKPIPPELLTLDSPVKPSEIFPIAAGCTKKAKPLFSAVSKSFETTISPLTN